MTHDTRADTDQPARPAKLVWVLCLLLLASALFVGLMLLGAWQVQRLHWKLALIERIEQRVNAASVAAPSPAEWSSISRESNEYSRVQLAGVFDHSRETRVRASTVLGRGFWLMTPLQTNTGFWVLVNRGFVPEAGSAPTSRPGHVEPQVVTGLLRLSEPDGSWLQRNDAAADQWYSRDVQAIAAKVKLSSKPVAPYFIDTVASPDAPAWPRGGLTVLNFNNHHLVYAITWFVLAAMVAAAAAYLIFSERRLRALATPRKPAATHA
jgi:surfeit locus 1 family protein